VQEIKKLYQGYKKISKNNENQENYIKNLFGLTEGLGSKKQFYDKFGKSSLKGLTEENRRVAIGIINTRLIEIVPDLSNMFAGHGLRRQKHIMGKVISTPADAADYTKEIMPDIKYVPFGRYSINHHKLSGDIISVKRPNGVNVSNIPVIRVSNDLGNVIRSIVDNGQQQYHQLKKLSDEEKLYLHKLAEYSNISDN
jgi:hypothetical protein